jgi:guanylate kinase
VPAEGAAAERGRRLVVLSGPSGSGKSTITRALATSPEVWRSVSATTRPPRPGEVDGRDYQFLSAAAFERGIAAGEFVEHAQVFGQWYGTPRRPLEKALAAGRWAVLDIDVQGGRAIRRLFPEATLIFIVPPSREALEARLRGRGTESPEAVARRLAAAEREMQQGACYDHVVVNDQVDRAVAEVRDILRRRESS